MKKVLAILVGLGYYDYRTVGEATMNKMKPINATQYFGYILVQNHTGEWRIWHPDTKYEPGFYNSLEDVKNSIDNMLQEVVNG